MSDIAKPLEILHDRAKQEFWVVVDGHHCEVDYHLEGKVMVITHTGVPDPVGGRGIANLLTRFAVQVARAEGWKVRPACSYAEQWFKRNPEYADLLA
ncbi:GNAT family N-acetyltransferase [Luteibacter yeojuensis]|uniref:N-acetyltransferase n=1 Tax=Luteibacter yeojuensis TaxID=345309 RepID=A0A7X5QT92_9GAMM|nr:GNAT family N-acetyltransferase [Luteibacter yeojuensis]NID14895.1 N-acetyltransferase [Luteibacter yeojuensis]